MHGAQVYTFTYVCTTFSAEGPIASGLLVIAGDGEVAEVGAQMPAMGAGFGAAAAADDHEGVGHRLPLGEGATKWCSIAPFCSYVLILHTVVEKL